MKFRATCGRGLVVPGKKFRGSNAESRKSHGSTLVSRIKFLKSKPSFEEGTSTFI